MRSIWLRTGCTTFGYPLRYSTIRIHLSLILCIEKRAGSDECVRAAGVRPLPHPRPPLVLQGGPSMTYTTSRETGDTEAKKE